MARYALVLIVFVPLAAGCGLVPLLNRRSAEESARLTDEAKQACERGERKQARELLSRAAAVAPDDPEIQRDIGRGLLLAGETEEAVKHLRYMMHRGVDDPDAYLDLARILFEERRYNECQELVDSALRLVPGHTEAQLLRGRLAEVRNRDEEALEIYYRMLAGDPSSTEAMLRISDLLVRTGQPSQAAPLLQSIADSDRVAPEEQARRTGCWGKSMRRTAAGRKRPSNCRPLRRCVPSSRPTIVTRLLMPRGRPDIATRLSNS